MTIVSKYCKQIIATEAYDRNLVQRSLEMFKFNLTSLGTGLRKCANTLAGIIGKIVSFCWLYILPLIVTLISWAIADMTGNILGKVLSVVSGYVYFIIMSYPLWNKKSPWAPLALYLVLVAFSTLYFERLMSKVVFTENRIIGLASLELYNPLSGKMNAIDKDQKVEIDIYGETVDSQPIELTLRANLRIGTDEKSLNIIKANPDWERNARLQVKADISKLGNEYIARTKAGSISEIEAAKAVMADIDAEKIHNLGFAWDGSMKATVITTK